MAIRTPPTSPLKERPLNTPSPKTNRNLTRFVKAYFEIQNIDPELFQISTMVKQLNNSIQPDGLQRMHNSPNHLTVTTKPLASGASAKIFKGLLLDKRTGELKVIARKVSKRPKPLKHEEPKFSPTSRSQAEQYLNLPIRSRDGEREWQFEYAEGGNLNDVEIPNRQPALFVAHLYEQIAKGFVFMADHNILHRDGKNDNFVYFPEQDQAKIIDFGGHLDLKKAQEQEVQVAGTLDHLDPYSFKSLEDQLHLNGRQDKATDVYYLARAMEEMLAKRLFPQMLGIDPVQTYTSINIFEHKENICDFDPDAPHYYFSYLRTLLKFDNVNARQECMLKLANDTGDNTAIALTKLTFEILSKAPDERMTIQQVHTQLSRIAKGYTRQTPSKKRKLKYPDLEIQTGQNSTAFPETKRLKLEDNNDQLSEIAEDSDEDELPPTLLIG